MDRTYNLHWADYLVFGIIMLTTVAIGVLFATTGGKQKTTDEYFTGDRNMGVIPAALSIVVSYMSAIMIIGVPAEAYLYGGQFLLASISFVTGTTLAALFIVPIIYPLKLVSVNTYLEMRFESKYPKLFGTFQSILGSIVYTSIVIYAPCTAISVFTGFPVVGVILVSAAISTFYTTIGGIKAVVWSDAFLCICMLGGMSAVAIQGIRYAGGIANAYEITVAGGRLDLFDWSINPTVRLSFWALLLGGTVDNMGLYGFIQSTVQRYSNVRTLRRAQLTVLISAVGNVLMVTIPVAGGLAIYAYYAHIGCDPLKEGLIDSPNELVPYFVMEALDYPGVPGLFVASITAGALSSVSSSLNAAAANTWEDFLKHLLPKISPYKASLVCKGLVLLYGVTATSLCFVVMFVGGTVYQLSFSIMSTLTIPVYGLYFAGFCCPWMNKKGLLGGGVCGFGFILWILLGQYFTAVYSRTTLPTNTLNCSDDTLNTTLQWSTAPHTYTYFATGTDWVNSTTLPPEEASSRSYLEEFYSVSYLWYRTFGVTIFLLVGSIISLITGRERASYIERRLLCMCYKHVAGEDEDEDDEAGETMLPQLRASWTQDEFYSVHKKSRPSGNRNSQL